MYLVESLAPYILAVLGLMFGSFIGASVWRLRALQLRSDKKHGIKPDAAGQKLLSALKNKSLANDHSVCLRCRHRLRWYDLVPVVSWLSLGGKCRYCRSPIGKFELAIEVTTALIFVLSYLLWPFAIVTPLEITYFAIFLASVVGLLVLFVYDLRWFLLPNVVVFPLIFLGLIKTGLVLYHSNFSPDLFYQILFGVFVLSGIYYLISVFRKDYIGLGDVKLGLALALLLASGKLSVLVLFAANVLGLIVILPALLAGKAGRKTRIPFGPFLISAYIIGMVFGDRIINWYFGLFLGSI